LEVEEYLEISYVLALHLSSSVHSPLAASVRDKILDQMDSQGGHFCILRSKSWKDLWRRAQVSAALTPGDPPTTSREAA